METYRQMTQRQQKEVNAFLSAHAFFAFSPDQYDKGLQKFSITKEDAPTLLCSIGAGGYMLKERNAEYEDLACRLYQEREAAIRDPETGYQFALSMFEYELANHEYIITGDAEETLSALGLSFDEVVSDPTLSAALLEAIQAISAEADEYDTD